MSIYLVVADRMAWSLGFARSLHTLGHRDPSARFVVMVPVDSALQVDADATTNVAREAAARARTSLQLEGLTELDAFEAISPPRKAFELEVSRGTRTYDGIVVGVTRRNPAFQVHPELSTQLEGRYGIPVQVISLDGTLHPTHSPRLSASGAKSPM